MTDSSHMNSNVNTILSRFYVAVFWTFAMPSTTSSSSARDFHTYSWITYRRYNQLLDINICCWHPHQPSVYGVAIYFHLRTTTAICYPIPRLLTPQLALLWQKFTSTYVLMVVTSPTSGRHNIHRNVGDSTDYTRKMHYYGAPPPVKPPRSMRGLLISDLAPSSTCAF